MEHEEVSGSAAEVGAAFSKPSDWKTLNHLGYFLLEVSIPLLKTIFCSESPDQMLGSIFPENKCLYCCRRCRACDQRMPYGPFINNEKWMHHLSGCNWNGRTIPVFTPTVELAICMTEHKQFLALLLLAWIHSTLDLHMDIESKYFLL